MVSYARSTYMKSNEFHEKLSELQKDIKPVTIRSYLAYGSKAAAENAELNLDLSDTEKALLDELKALRMSGIQAEMRYALVQAKRNGVQLPEEVVSGEAINPGFSQELLDKVPSLGVYNLFLLFTVEEFEH